MNKKSSHMYTQYIILDIEENIVTRNKGRSELIELAAVKIRISKDGKIVTANEIFQSYVHANTPLSKKTSKLTGILQKDIDSAPKFSLVWSDFINWIGPRENTFFVSWGPNDEKFLRRELSYALLSYPKNLTFIDFQKYIQARNNIKKLPGLFESVNNICGQFIGSKHCAKNDAVNTARLFKNVLEDSFQYISWTLFKYLLFILKKRRHRLVSFKLLK